MRRRQFPVLQERHDLSGFQLGPEIPLRCDRESHVADHRLAQPLRCGHFQPPLQLHRHLLGRLSKGPGRPAGAPRVDDRLMAAQLAGGRGRAMALKIGRRRHDNATALGDTARGHVGIRHRPHAQRHIDALVDQVHMSIVEHQLDLEVRVFGEERRQFGNDVEPPEADRRRHTKLAGETAGAAARGQHGLVGFLDRPLRPLIENAASLGRDHAARRTQQQTDSQPVLKLDDSLRNGRLSDTLRPRHRRKRAGVDDTHEELQSRKPVHSAHLWNKRHVFLRPRPTKWNR